MIISVKVYNNCYFNPYTSFELSGERARLFMKNMGLNEGSGAYKETRSQMERRLVKLSAISRSRLASIGYERFVNKTERDDVFISFWIKK